MMSATINGYQIGQLGSGLAANLTNPATQSMLGNSDFTTALSNNNIDINSLTTDQITGLYKGFQNNNSIDVTMLNNQGTDWNKTFSMNGMLGGALGLGQFGLGLAGYLDNRKTANKQREVLDQQKRANDYNYRKQLANDKAIAAAFHTTR